MSHVVTDRFSLMTAVSVAGYHGGRHRRRRAIAAYIRLLDQTNQLKKV